jgi:hypothetical protein
LWCVCFESFCFHFLQLTLEHRYVSSIACAGLHSRMLERIEPHRTRPQSTQRAHHNMHGSARVRSSAPWCARAHSFQNPHVTFLGHFSFPHFISPHAVQLSLLFSPFFSHTLGTQPPFHHPKHTAITSTHPPATATAPPIATAGPISRFHPHFYCFLTQTQLLQIRSFCPFFLVSKGTYPSTGCAIFDFCVGLLRFCRGLG